MGNLTITIDEEVDEAKKAINWTNSLVVKIPEEDHPDEMIERVIRQAMEGSKYSLYTNLFPPINYKMRIDLREGRG
jgi:hypothetical protein